MYYSLNLKISKQKEEEKDLRLKDGLTVVLAVQMGVVVIAFPSIHKV